MENESFAIRLLMSIIGVVFVAFAIWVIIVVAKDNIVGNYVKNNGEQMTATITYKSIENYYDANIKRNKRTITYYIKYVANNKEYSYEFESDFNNYSKNDKINIYSLRNNPEKVFVPLESKKDDIIAICVSDFLLIVGGLSIKMFNVFSYNREINIE